MLLLCPSQCIVLLTFFSLCFLVYEIKVNKLTFWSVLVRHHNVVLCQWNVLPSDSTLPVFLLKTPNHYYKKDNRQRSRSPEDGDSSEERETWGVSAYVSQGDLCTLNNRVWKERIGVLFVKFFRRSLVIRGVYETPFPFLLSVQVSVY